MKPVAFEVDAKAAMVIKRMGTSRMDPICSSQYGIASQYGVGDQKQTLAQRKKQQLVQQPFDTLFDHKAEQEKLEPAEVEFQVQKLVALTQSHLDKVAKIKNETGTKWNVHPYEPVSSSIPYLLPRACPLCVDRAHLSSGGVLAIRLRL